MNIINTDIVAKMQFVEIQAELNNDNEADGYSKELKKLFGFSFSWDRGLNSNLYTFSTQKIRG